MASILRESFQVPRVVTREYDQQRHGTRVWVEEARGKKEPREVVFDVFFPDSYIYAVQPARDPVECALEAPA